MLRSSKGFTLVEVLLAVALISLMTAVALPAASSLQSRNDVDVAAIGIAQNLRQAQQLAAAGSGDSNWGVSISSGSFTLYRGNSFATRDNTYDQINDMSAKITPTFSLSPSGSEVNFAKISGLPSATGTITLTGLNGRVVTLTINAQGMVGY